jgi:hypothetical protein
VLGVAALVALPAAVALAQVSPRVTLLQAGFGVPVAGVLGLAAVLAARGARRRSQWMLAPVGVGVARTGRALGFLALCVTASGTIALAVYELLVRAQ